MKKRLMGALLSAALSIAMATPAFAGWWIQDNVGWRYTNSVNYQSNGYKRIDGKLYYFTDEGYCLMNAVTPDGKYVVDENGVVIKDGVPDILTFDQNPTYTLGINEAIWDLMNHTRAENAAKYGLDGVGGYAGSYKNLPFTATYVGDMLTSEQQEAGGWSEEKPYIITLFTDEEKLSYAFLYAPLEDEIPLVDDIMYGHKNGYKRDVTVVVRKLRELGYDAKFIKSNGLNGDLVQFKIDRFLVTISYGNFYSEIQIRQEMQDFVKKEYNKISSGSLATGL